MIELACEDALDVSPAEIADHLERILASRRFTAADRNARFLRYVVERVLEGRADEIKEVVIATEVYGRPSDYDPKIDSIVRVEATRLRTRLDTYYREDGRFESIRIRLPKGTYVPCFEKMPGPETPVPLVEEPPPPAVISERGVTLRSNLRVAVWIAIGLSVFLAGWFLSPPQKPGTDPEALVAWNEGNELLRQDPHNSVTERGAPSILLRAIERYEFAVAKDPSFAGAWASLAEAYDYAFPYVDRVPAEDARKAEAAARRAIEIDGNLAYGHAMLALVQSRLRWDFARAESSYRKAIALDPRNYNAVIEYADLLREAGRTEDAAAVVRRARALLPVIPALAVKEADILLDQNRVDAAIQAATAAMELNQHYYRSYLTVGSAWEAKGDADRALHYYRQALHLNKLDRRVLPAYGYLLGVRGRAEEASSVLQQLIQMNSRVRNCAFQIAIVYTGLGRHQDALDWLERAWQTHQVHFPFAGVEPRLRALHQYPRFHELLSRVGRKAERYQ